MKATYKLVFNRHKKLDSEGKGLVSIYVYLSDKNKIYVSTGIRVEYEYWNGMVTGHHNAIKLNEYLREQMINLESYEMDIIRRGRAMTMEDVKQFGSKESRDSFVSWLQEQINSDRTVSPGTKSVRLTMLTRLQACAGDVHFSAVNAKLIDKFNNYLHNMGLEKSTIKKYHNQLKKFSRIALRDKIVKDDPYAYFKLVLPRKLKTCLWYDELKAIEELVYTPESSLEAVRQRFLFSCYTGLRISDTHNVRLEMIRGGKLYLSQVKTMRDVIIPFTLFGGKAERLMEKIKLLNPGGKVLFPKLTDQFINETLKVIQIDANVPFVLTFHVARHTFCTMVAAETGSVFEVMRYAGHSKVETAMVYVNLAKMMG